jgi:hypothetical protein
MNNAKRECDHPGCRARCRFIMHADEVTIYKTDGTVVERGVVTSRPYIPIDWKHGLARQGSLPDVTPAEQQRLAADARRITDALRTPFTATPLRMGDPRGEELPASEVWNVDFPNDQRCNSCGHRKAAPSADCGCCSSAHTGCGGSI